MLHLTLPLIYCDVSFFFLIPSANTNKLIYKNFFTIEMFKHT